MYQESSYGLQKMAEAIVKERQAEADTWRLAHELESHSHQPLRTRLARTLTHAALRLDRRAAQAELETEAWEEAAPGFRAG